MHTNIRKWGNSSGTVIPATILQEAGLEVGDALDVQVVEGKIILSPVESELTLEDLLAGSPKENLAITDEDREWLDTLSVGGEI